MDNKIETEAKIELKREEYYDVNTKAFQLASKSRPVFLYRHEPKIEQTNRFYDLNGKILRVRYEKIWDSPRWIVRKKLTWKNPIDSSSKYKEVEEIERDASEINDLEKVIGLLGKKVFEYNKERQNYRFNDCIISLDVLKIDRYFVEIEGKEKKIDKVIKLLGLKDKPLEKRSYVEILKAHSENKDGGRHGKR